MKRACQHRTTAIESIPWDIRFLLEQNQKSSEVRRKLVSIRQLIDCYNAELARRLSSSLYPKKNTYLQTAHTAVQALTPTGQFALDRDALTITVIEIKECIAVLLLKYQPVTVKTYVQYFSALFEWGRKIGVLNENPFADLRVPQLKIMPPSCTMETMASTVSESKGGTV